MIEWTIPTMSCGHCVGAITQTVQALDPQARLQFDLPQHKVTIDSQADAKVLAEALAEAGYAPDKG